MKKTISLQPVSTVKVENYQTESTNMPLAFLLNLKPTCTPDTPTLLYFRGIPKELADILESRVMAAMVGQNEYQDFLISLKNS